MTEINISPVVKKALDMIETKDYGSKELSTFYENAVKYRDITEEERELVVQAIERKIRLKNPRHAKKLFGPKDTEARELLQKIYDQVSSDYDLAQNRVGSGVKTGGHMIAGKAYVDVYISYKNHDKWHVGLGVYQVSAEAEPKLRVRRYQGGENNAEGRELNEYSINELDLATEKYTKQLANVIQICK